MARALRPRRGGLRGDRRAHDVDDLRGAGAIGGSALILTIALAAAFALLVLAIATWAHVAFWSRRYALALEYADHEEIETPDGATIDLRRIPVAPDVARAGAPPVLLVHGVGANHRNQDLDVRSSLARYLAGRGRDVWLLTLRSGRPRSRNVRFEAMVRYDVPIGAERVLERTRAPELDYVGFSMGGMLLYAALGRTLPASRVRRAVIIGSPGIVRLGGLVAPLASRLPRRLVPTLRFRFLSRLVAFASEWFTTPFHGIAMNPRNVARGTTRSLLVNLVEDIPGSLNADFIDMARHGGKITYDGAPALEGLARIEVPALFIAGSADNVAPPAAVRAAFDAWAKETPAVEKIFRLVGRESGEREDYGHGDLAFGERAPDEVFAPIARFLGDRAA